MHIYKITNRINKKSYIGLTTAQNPIRRFIEHKSCARYKKATYLERAMNKYGFINFSFEIIKSFDKGSITLDKLLEEEVKSIHEHNTLIPNGYNVILRATTREKSQEQINKTGISLHNNILKKNKYKGVKVCKGIVRCEIRRNNHRYYRSFATEKEAAIAYDKMSLILYPKLPPINFPNKKYTKKQLNECFELFESKNARRGNGKYYGVSFDSERKKYNAYYYRPNMKRRFLKRFKTAEQARDALKEEFLKNGLIYDENGKIKEMNPNA